MQKSIVTKSKFSQTNDKRFYNLNGITSLPIGHPYFKDLTAYKENKGENIEKYLIEEKENFKRLEIEAFRKNDRSNLYNQMLSQKFEYFEYYDLSDNTKIDHHNLKLTFLNLLNLLYWNQNGYEQLYVRWKI